MLFTSTTRQESDIYCLFLTLQLILSLESMDDITLVSSLVFDNHYFSILQRLEISVENLLYKYTLCM